MKINKKTKVINLYGGPGTGKTTLASRLFSDLNMSKPFGQVALVQEYAFMLICQGRESELAHQPSVTEGQINLMRPFAGNIDMIITDSPLELGLIYASPEYLSETGDKIYSFIESAQIENINIFIEKAPDNEEKFDLRGRIHNFEESIAIDKNIKDFFETKSIPYVTVQNGNIEDVIQKIVETIGNCIAKSEQAIFCGHDNETLLLDFVSEPESGSFDFRGAPKY